jgi:hypothetical protein
LGTGLRPGKEVNSDIHPAFVFSSQETRPRCGPQCSIFCIGSHSPASCHQTVGQGKTVVHACSFLLCASFTLLLATFPSCPSGLPRSRMWHVASKYYFLYGTTTLYGDREGGIRLFTKWFQFLQSKYKNNSYNLSSGDPIR